jgi:hypothetical protein
LRTTWELSCLGVLASEAGKEASGSGLFLSEGMVSIALNVRDDRWWGVTCLKDEFLLKKAVLEDETGDGDEEDEDEDNDTTTTDRRGPPIEGSYLQHIDLEQVDPILNEGSGYTDKNPRVYMLVALDKQLEGLVQRAELLYRTFYGVIKAYVSIRQPLILFLKLKVYRMSRVCLGRISLKALLVKDRRLRSRKHSTRL